MLTLFLDRFGRVLQMKRPGASPDDDRAQRPAGTRATYEFDDTTNPELANRLAVNPTAFAVVGGVLMENDAPATVAPDADRTSALKGLVAARRDIRAYLSGAPVDTPEGRALRAACRLVLGLSEGLK